MTEPPIKTQSYLARQENVLVLAGQLSPIASELELHALSNGLTYDPFVRQILCDGLTALALHLAARPVDEYVGWTVSVQKPPMNLFFTGNCQDESLAGRAFLDEGEVRPRDRNLLVAQSRRPGAEPHESFVEVDGIDIFAMIEHYYRQSEQRQGRFLTEEGRDAILLQSLPDSDVNWLRDVTRDELEERIAGADLQLLAERRYRHCGCDRARMIGMLKATYGSDTSALFEGDERVELQCRRCAARLEVTEDEYRSYLGED